MTGVLVAILTFCGFSGSVAVADFPQVRLQPISSNELVAPVGLANAADGSGRLFAIDQRGAIQILQGGSLLPTAFLDIGAKLVGQRAGFDERGLLGLAFHPQYGTVGTGGEGKFYVYYSAPSPDAPGTEADPVDHHSVIAEYMVSGPGSNIADPNSERILMTFNQPQFNHDGGQLAFGPDGMLYISTGDGGSGNDNNAGHTGGDVTRPLDAFGNAQDRTNLLGKVLRIDVNGSNAGQYGIPNDNPFVAAGGGVRQEIYAYGLRNPWRFSFDDGPGGTDRLFLADVGQGDVEEVNIITSGGNYGWRIREGAFDFAQAVGVVPNPVVPLIDPIAQYSREGRLNALPKIGLTVVGGYVYRGSEFPELIGKYVFADWSTAFGAGNGTLLGLEEGVGGDFTLSVLDVEGGNPIGLYITAIGEDESGELYVVAKSVLAPDADPDSGLPTAMIFKIAVVPEPASICVLVIGASGLIWRKRGGKRRI